MEIALKHRRPTRWFHWINVLVLPMMIWSGLLIYWANDVYHIGPIKFFPNGFYSAFHIDHRLAEGMAWHFFLQWIFILNGLAYVVYSIVSGEWRELFPRARSFPEAWGVLLHDLGLSDRAPPERKFNAAQQIAYTGIVLCGLGSALTGYAIYKPVQLGWLRAAFGGYDAARLIHFVLTLGYVFFFIIHLAQVIRAGWNNFRAMVTGYELRKQR